MASTGSSPPPPTLPRAPARRGWRWLLWLPFGVVAAVLLAVAAAWTWAGTPGSLAQALRWAQSWTQANSASAGALEVAQVQGSLRAGGVLGRLQWSRDGFSVSAEQVRLDLGDGFWMQAALGRGIHLGGVSMDRLQVNDQRPPSSEPLEPLQSLTLPWPVSLSWAVNRFELHGSNPLVLDGVSGRYAYGQGRLERPVTLPGTAAVIRQEHAHQLLIDDLGWAGGRYRAQMVLGGVAPMPLAVAVQGEARTEVPGRDPVPLQLRVSVGGALGGPDAVLDLNAQAQTDATPGAGGPPALSAVARLRPWAAQPLFSASVSTRALDLSALWPQAPVTALTGTLQAEPDGTGWRARLNVSNTGSGPADQHRLPMDSLRLALSQVGDRWSVSDLDARLAGGQVTGRGQATVRTAGADRGLSAWQGELRATALQPSRVWSALAPGALDAEFQAQAVPGPNQAVDLTANVRPAANPGEPAPTATTAANAPTLRALRLEELALQGRWLPATGNPAQGVLELQSARLAAAGASLDARGEFDTAARRYSGQLQARAPGASAGWSGTLAHAEGSGNAIVQLADAARVLDWLRGLQDLPMVGAPLKQWLQGQPGLAVRGSATLNAQWTGGLGALGYPAPASAPSPIGAPPALPNLQAALAVPGLQWQSQAMDPVAVSGLQLSAQGTPAALQLKLTGDTRLTGWQASLNGDAQAVLPEGNARQGRLIWNAFRLQLNALAEESATPTPAANGWAAQIEQPVTLQWASSAQGVSVDAGEGALRLQPTVPAGGSGNAASARLAWERLVWQAGGLSTRGRLSGLPLAWVDALAPVAPGGQGTLRAAGLNGDLSFGGDWDLDLPADATQPARLKASLQRSSGDLLLLSDRSLAAVGAAQGRASAQAAAGAAPPSRLDAGATAVSNGNGQPVAAGVREARVDLALDGQALSASLRWESDQLGEATARVATQIATPAQAGAVPADTPALDRWWPADTPMTGNLRARLPQVGVWSALAPPGWRVRGTLAADATLGGTRANPQWQGTLEANELALRSVVDGFFFSGGQLRATLAGERLTIDRFSINGPRGAERGGTLSATGTAEWRRVEGQTLRQPFIDLTLNANRLRVAARADRRLELSGEVKAALAGPQLQLRGRLKADSALFVLPDETTPSLGSDVVVRTTRTLEVQPTLAEQVKADVSVDLDLGEQFMVRGQGLETRLAGAINVRSTPSAPTPRLTGEVRTVSGTYQAYGQQLAIENGALRFNGPYDNPSLDILAVRKLPEATGQRVGVQITGSAQVPRVRLFSDPELPDSEKLAWLVLGRPASAAGAQAFVLQQAARTLLAGNKDLADGDLARSFGLDEVGFQGQTTAADGSTTEAAFTLGKRLSDDLYLSYERSLSSAMSTVSMFYDLSRRLTLRARAGTENAVDLIFTVQYD